MMNRRILKVIQATALVLLVCLTSGCTAKMRAQRHVKKADDYYAAGDLEKAKIEYLTAIRTAEQGAHPYLRSGEIWLTQGVPLRAGPFLYRATQLAPNDIQPKLKMARAYLSIGASVEAHRSAVAAVEQDPNNGEALLLLAESSRNADDAAVLASTLQKLSNHDTMPAQVITGAVALMHGDLAGATAAFRRASEIDPQAPSPHTGMASLYIAQKNIPQAEAELKTAADLSSPRSAERINYAQFLAQSGKVPEAEAYLKQMTAQVPDYIPPWRMLAQIAQAQNRIDDGLKFLAPALAIDPDNADCRMIEASLRMASGDAPKAIQILDRLAKTFPNIPKIKMDLAKAYMRNNDLPAAGGALNDLVTANPNLTEAVLMLAQVNLRLGDLQKVVAGMQGFLKKQPQNIDAEVLLAEAYRQLGQPAEAVAIYQDQVKRQPERPQSWAALGLALRQMNELGAAAQAFQTTLLLVPQNTLALDQLVEIKIQQQDFDGALAAVDRQLGESPDSARTYLSQGKVFVAQRQWDKASAAFRKAVELEPSLTAAYDLLVSSYIASEKVPEAIAQLQELVANKPDNASALLLLGAMYERNGDREKARDAYERALAVKADFSQAMNNLACIYIDDNQLDRAADLARKARTLQPNDASIADTLAWVVYKQGDYRQAFGILQEFAPKLEDNPTAQFHLGMAAYMMGQKDVARAALSKSIEPKTDLPYRKEAEDRLALLNSGGADAPQASTAELEKLVQQQPNDTLLLMRLADAAENDKDFAKAADAAQRALKVNPKLIAPTLKLARYFAGPLKSREKALDYAKKARELAPADPDVAATLGQVALDSGNYSWAYSLLKESARQRLEDPVLQREYAWAAYDIGKFGEAKEAMQRVAALSPSGPDADDAQRFLTFAAGNGAGAALGDAQINDALRSNPTYTPALMARADELRKSGDSKGAEKIYAEISERLPEFAPAQIALADIYVDDPAKVAAAADLVAKARKTLPDDPQATELLAEISFQRKEYPRAIQLFQDARRKRPLSARGLFHLGLSFAQNKQAQQATDAINQALAAGLPESSAVTAKQTLADLQK